MEEEVFLTIFQKVLVLTMEMCAPVLITSIVVGLLISIVQSVTQIQESTLTFVPKIVGCVILLIFLMPWIFSIFITTVNEFMDAIPQLIGAG